MKKCEFWLICTFQAESGKRKRKVTRGGLKVVGNRLQLPEKVYLAGGVLNVVRGGGVLRVGSQQTGILYSQVHKGPLLMPTMDECFDRLMLALMPADLSLPSRMEWMVDNNLQWLEKHLLSKVSNTTFNINSLTRDQRLNLLNRIWSQRILPNKILRSKLTNYFASFRTETSEKYLHHITKNKQLSDKIKSLPCFQSQESFQEMLDDILRKISLKTIGIANPLVFGIKSWRRGRNDFIFVQICEEFIKVCKEGCEVVKLFPGGGKLKVVSSSLLIVLTWRSIKGTFMFALLSNCTEDDYVENHKYWELEEAPEKVEVKSGWCILTPCSYFGRYSPSLQQRIYCLESKFSCITTPQILPN